MFDTARETQIAGQSPFLPAGALAAAAQVSAFSPAEAFGLTGPLPATGSWPWPSTGLDPVAAARGSLNGLGGCSAMSFGLIVNGLKDVMPDSAWQVIGRRQLKRAFNGAGPCGADCGGLHGPLCLMAMVGVPPVLAREFCQWYCDFAFPSGDWDDLYPIKNTVQSVAKSPLCHQSREVWEVAFTRQVYSVSAVFDSTRCSKLSRDCVRKAVELVNACKVAGRSDAGAMAS